MGEQAKRRRNRRIGRGVARTKRHAKSKDGKRVQRTVWLSPKNDALLNERGAGANDFLNYLLEKEREKEQ